MTWRICVHIRRDPANIVERSERWNKPAVLHSACRDLWRQRDKGCWSRRPRGRQGVGAVAGAGAGVHL